MPIAAPGYAFTGKRTKITATWVPISATVPDGYQPYDCPLDLTGLKYNQEYKIACIIPKTEFYVSFQCGALLYSNCLIETDSTTEFTPMTIMVESQTSGAINAIYVNGQDILFDGYPNEAETASKTWRLLLTVDAPPSLEDVIHTGIKILTKHASQQD